MLDQPQLPKDELIGLARTFGLYQTLPKSKWKYIEKAESNSPESVKLREQLRKDYQSQAGKTLAVPDTIDA